MSAGASPESPLEEHTALPQTPSCFQGGRFAAGGDWRTRGGEEGKEGERGVGGIGVLVVGGIDAPAFWDDNERMFWGQKVKGQGHSKGPSDGGTQS